MAHLLLQAIPDRPHVVTVGPADITRKLAMRRGLQASDSSSNVIDVGDIVTLPGAYEDVVEGTVKYIQRGALFLQSR